MSKKLVLCRFLMTAGIDESIKELFQKQYVSKGQHVCMLLGPADLLKSDFKRRFLTPSSVTSIFGMEG